MEILVEWDFIFQIWKVLIVPLPFNVTFHLRVLFSLKNNKTMKFHIVVKLIITLNFKYSSQIQAGVRCESQQEAYVL